MIDMQTGRS